MCLLHPFRRSIEMTPAISTYIECKEVNGGNPVNARRFLASAREISSKLSASTLWYYKRPNCKWRGLMHLYSPSLIGIDKSRWDALPSNARRRWRLSWISWRSTESCRCGTALRIWKRNAVPLTVSKRDRNSRFIPAGDSGEARLLRHPQ